MRKGTHKATHHDKKAEPVKVPKMADESKPLMEAVTPQADPVPAPKADCRNCQHASAMHYGSANNWCNTSGCQCQAYE